MRSRTHVAVLAVVLLAAGCKQADNTVTKASGPEPAADPAAVQAAIDGANNSFMTALQRGDTAAATVNYTDDAVVMMPGEEAWIGPAVHQKMVEFMKQFTIKDPKFIKGDLLLSGDLAVERGGFEWTLVPKTGKPVQDKGKYLTVWQKQPDGSWKIVRDINNSSRPVM
jgi:ketosteroid isomerase-like protein